MCGGRLVLQTIRKQFLGNLLGRAFPPHQKVPVFGTSQYYCCRQFETISWESPSLAYKHRDPPWVQKKWNKDTSSKQIVAKETKTHRVDVFELFSHHLSKMFPTRLIISISCPDPTQFFRAMKSTFTDQTSPFEIGISGLKTFQMKQRRQVLRTRKKFGWDSWETTWKFPSQANEWIRWWMK